MRIYRQGDILIVERKAPIPTTAKLVPLENGRLVLAHGEVTGHAHVVIGDAELFAPADVDELEDRFLRVEQEAQLMHDEHGTIVLPATEHGYDVRRQREYAPEEIRVVAD